MIYSTLLIDGGKRALPFPGAGIDRHSLLTASLLLEILMKAHFCHSRERPCMRIEILTFTFDHPGS